jgi:hypothetical protein
MPRPRHLIKDVLYSDLEHVLFGPQGVTKSLLLIDWILHMAYRLPWMGKPTKLARSLIVCGEGGGRMLADRIAAWIEYHQVDGLLANECLRVTEYPIEMLAPGQVGELLELIDAEQRGFDFIAIDTLMANFGPGDENAQVDMAAFCRSVRDMRLHTRAGVLVVHHVGHGNPKRPQGANALRRNIDIELRVDRHPKDNALFTLTGGGDLKSRHNSGLGQVQYRLRPVRLKETDGDGAPVISCVLIAADKLEMPKDKMVANLTLSKNQRPIFEEMCRIAESSGQGTDEDQDIYISKSEFYCMCEKVGVRPPQRANSVRKSFLKRGWFVEAPGGYWWKPPYFQAQ